jgi:Uma2 family endonuclease
MQKTLDRIAPASVRLAIEYPESDGKPMGETQVHIRAMIYLYQVIEFFFRQAEQIYVTANMLFYYEEGNPARFIVPDVYVVKGVAKHLRRIYKLWEERAAPCVVFEITSRSSQDEDWDKRALYERLGVREYFLFDPLDEYLDPRLQGLRLVRGRYQPMLLLPDGTLYSAELGLVLRPEGVLLRLVDPASGETLPTLDEAMALAQIESERARSETERASAEARRAERAEAELARLRAELERLRQAGDHGSD